MLNNLQIQKIYVPLQSFRTKVVLTREHSSVGLEHLPYKQRVGGSTPSAPTKALDSSKAFFFVGPLMYTWCIQGIKCKTQCSSIISTRGKSLNIYLWTLYFTDTTSHVSQNWLDMTRDPDFPYKFHQIRQSRVWKQAKSNTWVSDTGPSSAVS